MLFLALFTAAYFGGSVCAASRRYFFFDEIMTSCLGDLPDIRQIWPLIGRGIELNPPLPFWISWMLHHTIGDGPVISRIPAMIGFWLMCFCLYHFVRRRCGIVYGFAALLMPLFTYPAWDSAVARGYGLLLGMSGLALLSWQAATDGGKRRWVLCGLALAVAGAVSCHYYAVYVVGAIALGELVRTDERRKIDFAVCAALLAGLSPLLVYADLVRSAAAGASKGFWVSALPRFLYESYADLLGPTAIVFLGLLVLLIWRASQEEESAPILWTAPALPRRELVPCIALAAMPLVLYIAGVVFSIPFYTRYVQPVTIGFTVIVAAFAHRIGSASARFRNLMALLLFWWCLLPWTFWQTIKLVANKPPAEYLEFRPKLPIEAGLPIVMDSESDFIEYFFYGGPRIRSLLYNPLDRARALKFRGSDTAQRSLEVAQSFRDIHNLSYDAFVAAHREFIVARMREEGWVVQSLIADGATLELIELHKGLGYYVESASFYHVRMPDRKP